MLTIEGFFDGQKIEAVEKVPFIEKKRVLITFLENIPYLPISERKTPAQVLLDLFGTWDDNRDADEIAAEIRNARKNSIKWMAIILSEPRLTGFEDCRDYVIALFCLNQDSQDLKIAKIM